MNRRSRKVVTRFARETRFEVAPRFNVPLRGPPEAALEELKSRLLGRLLAETGPDLETGLRHAANEAAALAWLTPFPLLLLPQLLEEKAEAARHRSRLQKKLLARGAGRVKCRTE